jgi:hypothetical protein
VDQDDWLVCEVGLSRGIGVSCCPSGQPLSQPGDGAGAVGDDPEGEIDSAAGVFRRVVRAAPELRGTPIPGDDHTAEKTRQARVFGEADNDVEISNPPATAQVMLGAALREGDDAYPVPPASKVRVAGEERCEFSFRGAPQPSEVGPVEALVRARWITVSAFTMRHVEADTTGCAILGPPGHTAPPALLPFAGLRIAVAGHGERQMAAFCSCRWTQSAAGSSTGFSWKVTT